VIENYPEGQVEEFEAPNHPQQEAFGTRKIPFSREIYIERDDFMEDPPKKFFRLAPGREVRLRCAYFIKCEAVVRDPDSGEIVELRCSYDPATRGGSSPDGRKVKGTIHWVCASRSVEAEVRVYDRLFLAANPDAGKTGNYRDLLNPNSLQTLRGCRLEPGLAAAKADERYQFERLGYYCLDAQASTAASPVFNQIVTLRDSWGQGASG
ncbi:MAG: glutamine--tRNA ligase, partial [Desulfuromonadaceae bacterium]